MNFMESPVPLHPEYFKQALTSEKKKKLSISSQGKDFQNENINYFV